MDSFDPLTPRFTAGTQVRSRVASGVVSEVSWSPVRGDWGYLIEKPDDGRRPVFIYERQDEVKEVV